MQVSTPEQRAGQRRKEKDFGGAHKTYHLIEAFSYYIKLNKMHQRERITGTINYHLQSFAKAFLGIPPVLMKDIQRNNLQDICTYRYIERDFLWRIGSHDYGG